MYENQPLRHLSIFAMFFLFMVQINGQDRTPINIALDYINQNLEELGLNPSDISEFRISDQYTSKHNGLTHLYLIQQFEEIDIEAAMINVNIMETEEVSGIGNRFVSDLREKVNTATPSLSHEDALRSVLTHLNFNSQIALKVDKELSRTEWIYEHENIAQDPIKIKLNFFPVDSKNVRLAWRIYFSENSSFFWSLQVDAVNGTILDQSNRVIHCEFGHAKSQCSHLHPQIQTQELANTSFIGPMAEGNGTYWAMPLGVESPNHGAFELHDCPADLIASPYGWHDTTGVEGHEFTITQGNNVHAYQDVFDKNESSGDEPDGGDSLMFVFPYDTSSIYPYTQLDAAITNLFYWNNLVHDVWYHYGFDEEAGNFQANNYGNGGLGNDWVRAQAIDGSGVNNANFFTPQDGERPRMQMYIWGGSLIQNVSPLQIIEPANLVGYREAIPALFGGSLPMSYDEAIIGELAIVQDTTNLSTDACEEIINPEDVEGKIAIIDRNSECDFSIQAYNAQKAGAIAALICNNAATQVFAMPAGEMADSVQIPTLMASMGACALIKEHIDSIVVRLVNADSIPPLPGPTGRDSDLDNGVIVHEYTHGISNRLTGGPSADNCLRSNQQPEQAGEGWSDWFGLVMTTTPDMTAEQPRGIGTYVTYEPTDGNGIRTYPYSRDMDINPHTYANINGESIPHGRGSIFCVTLWDLFWNLVDEYGYDEDMYYGEGGNNIAMQLVTDGMKLQPCLPNHLDSRDAILEADRVNYDGANQCLIWETFARRGYGVSAFPGGEEAFDKPEVFIKKFGPDEALTGDTLTYTLRVGNGANSILSDVVILDTLPLGSTFVEASSDCGGTVTDGVLSLNIGDIDRCTVKSCSYQVVVPLEPFSVTTYEEHFDIGGGQWSKENDGSGQNWQFSPFNSRSGAFCFFAESIDTLSDQYLIQKNAEILPSPSAYLGFWHVLDTEEGFDGGVVEISVDEGDWQDIGDYAIQNGYNTSISSNSNSALAGKPAFGGLQETYVQSVFDLSTFAGASIKIRFRYATDEANAEEDQGWRIDDVAIYSDFHSISNKACFTDNEGVEHCDNVRTLIFEQIINNDEEVLLEEEILLYPNPTKDFVIIKSLQTINEAVEIQIWNMNGQLLESRKLDQLVSEEFDLSRFSTGMYLMKIQTQKGILTKKIIVE